MQLRQHAIEQGNDHRERYCLGLIDAIRTIKTDIYLHNVKVMAHPLAGANVDRGVEVEIRWKHRKQKG
jgi:uncharacterized protein YqfA (UPF0365 family)